MKKTNYSIALILIIPLLISCSNSTKKNPNQVDNKISFKNENTDSTKLTNLIRHAYKWHMENHLDDFPYKYDKTADSIFIGIDWDNYNKNVEVFRNTNFFTDEFLSFHKAIASNIDASIKKANIKWRNINDGISIWDSEEDDWCSCQDYPDNYWKTLTIDSLKINNNFASFYWNWNLENVHSQNNYNVTAKRVGKQWKINSLEGYKYYGAVKDYDKIMEE